MSKQEVRTWLDPETVDVLDSIVDSSKEMAEIWDMSQSEAVREVVETGIQHLGENPDLKEMVSDISLKLWQDKKDHERRRKKAKLADRAGGWRGQVEERFDNRLAGNQPYPPDKIEYLADSYFGDIVNAEVDPETLEPNEEKIDEHREWLDDLIEQYKEAYRAKQVVPSEAFEGHDDVQTGSDLLQLRDHFGEVLREIEETAEAEAYDPDAIYRAVASEHGVEVETIELIVDKLTEEDTDPRRALKSGRGILGAVDNSSLTEWSDGEADEITPEADTVDSPQLTDGAGAEETDVIETTDEITPEADVIEADTHPDDGEELGEVEADPVDAQGDRDLDQEPDHLGVPDGYDPTDDEIETPDRVVDKAESLLRSGDSMAEIYNAVRKHVTSDDVCEAVIEEAQARLDGDGAEEISVDTEASTESTQAATDGGDLNE
jgi:hypothetical protein